MNRHTVFFLAVCLCILVALVGFSWLTGQLSRVYVNPLYGQSILGGRTGDAKVIACIGLPHFDKSGFVFCQGDLVYHAWAYSTPIDDTGFVKEIQEMKHFNRGH